MIDGTSKPDLNASFSPQTIQRYPAVRTRSNNFGLAPNHIMSYEIKPIDNANRGFRAGPGMEEAVRRRQAV